MMLKRLAAVALLCGALLPSPGIAHPEPAVSHFTPRPLSFASRPEELGFDSTRLKRLDSYVSRFVADGEFAGATTLLARKGKIVQFNSYGRQAVGGAPMRKDSIFRIYSMTKPITGVAVLMLLEDGKLRLDDPISMHMPEFGKLKVITGWKETGQPVLEDAKRPPTIRELMNHTAGYAYGLNAVTPVDKLYRANGALQAGSMDEFIAKASRLPLLFQPGTSYDYSLSVDIQGALVERVSGQRFGDFLQQRIFAPLRMVDTGFHVPGAKLGRLAGFYNGRKDSQLQPATTVFGWPAPDPSRPVGFESGGAGLYSTTMDYARFAQMLLNGGELDGARILSPAAVRMLSRNHLPDDVIERRVNGFSKARGFGLDVEVHDDPASLGSLEGRGTYSWAGAAGTWFWIDPEHQVIFVGMVQRFDRWAPDHPNKMSTNLVYQALVRP
jgi:CubicO group peptidase (beta-lactamase class C family)